MSRRKLVEFKTRQLLKLRQLEQRLKEEHPDKSKRIEEVISELCDYVHKTLRRDRIADYVYKVMSYAREFQELAELVREEEVSEVLEEKA